ncbi:hypothetical protein CJ179_38620 [Rhodococcus sp. ACS1]|uniref:dATP/dGTP diphosphohydrolase domain-containing protein n=1 Tax=Rhodococcus sp. ACS1 TaxID=2028570 RepID=UPI000BB10B78|nr:dATP/dGTP diphosphohydrolase domain-containing protein [Rhodococcus sp. ACS1]PBC38515.1 hypothetical protein CJ179_38620 [Rhodococcus sp. ACS1]
MTDEIRSVSSTGGEKGVKLARYDLIPAVPLRDLAEHYGRGAEKYDDNQWRKGYEWSKSFAALQRHAWQFWSGEDYDEETGSPHMAAVAWHAFALLEFMRTHPNFDDRHTATLPPDLPPLNPVIGTIESGLIGASFDPKVITSTVTRQLPVDTIVLNHNHDVQGFNVGITGRAA